MKNYLILVILLLFASCGVKNENKDTPVIQRQLELTENYVDTMMLNLTDFNCEVVCNGKLSASLKAQLAFRHNDIISTINVQEGQWVKKGTLLAITDEINYQRELERAERELEKTGVDLVDKLLQLGYNIDINRILNTSIPTDDNSITGDSIPSNILRRAEITSGYYSAQYQLQTARRDLNDCRLVAPISGLIANLQACLHQKADKFGAIIDDSLYDVDFSILEAELPLVRKNQPVRVTPFADDSLTIKGKILSINPRVDDKGIVRVTAQIPGHPRLLDGMNVRVVVERSVPNMFVVPKEAVVERDGYNVIFLFDNGRARWTYVDILASNITSHAISGCKRKGTTLQDGSIVITSGNLNLADDTIVKIR